MSEKLKHSPLPWVATKHPYQGGIDYLLKDCDGEEIGILYQTDGMDYPTTYPIEENAELIALAVNNHERLVATVESLLYWLRRCECTHTKPIKSIAFRGEPVEYSVVTEARALLAVIEGAK